MAVSKQVADAYKNHFGIDVIGDTVESPVLPSGSAEAIISLSKIGAEALQSTKEVPPVEMPELPTFRSISKSAFAPQGSAEYNPSQGIGYDYTTQSKQLSDTELQDALRKQQIKDSGSYNYSGAPSEPTKALLQEKTLRDQERQRILDQNDMLERKINFQARQKDLGVSALDEAASYVGTSKFTDMTGVDYLNPLFYAAKAADMVVTAHKAVAQGAISAVGTLGASIDLNAGDNIVGDFGEAVADYAKIIKQKYPQLNPSKNIGRWEDPEFYVKGVAEMIPNLLGGVAASIAGATVGGAATVNPAGAVVGGVAGALSFGYAMESGNIYDDLVTRGYSPASAELGSKAYGAIAALPEAFFHIRGVGSAVMHPVMEEVMKKGLQAELKQTLFTGAKKLTTEGVKKGTGAAIEGSTEALQQLAQNTITKFYDKNQELFDGIPESFVFGAGSGGIVEAGQIFGGKDLNKEAVIALQNEKALKQAVKATELLQKTYPKDRDIAALAKKTKTELQNAQLQTKVIDAKFTQANTMPIVKNEVLDATISKTVKGKFIATFDATLDGKSVTFTTAIPSLTEQDAQIEAAQKTQKWLEDQVSSGQVTNIEEAKVLNTSLKDIISPKQDVVTEEVQNTIEDIKKNTSETNDKINSLIEEAKKYKSAEEFIKGENKKGNFIFRAESEKTGNGGSDFGYGEYYTIDYDTANKYGGEKTKIMVDRYPANPLIIEEDFSYPEIINKAKNQGYDGNKFAGALDYLRDNGGFDSVVVKEKGGRDFVVLKEVSKTKKTLINLFKEDVQPKNNEFVSKLSQRMADEFGTEKIMADKININEESKKAVEMVLKDKDKAYRVAMGIDDVSSTEQTFVNNALYMRAVEEGNFDLANKLIKKGSMVVTDAAQTLNAAKASVSDNSARKYLQELMLTRFLMVNEKYTADIQDKQEKTSPTQRVKKQIKKDVESVRKYISEKKKLDITQAQDFISSLQCK